MHIPNFIRQIPGQIEYGFIRVIIKGAETKEKVEKYWEAKCDKWSQSELWQQHGKALYERNIEPLTSLDYTMLGGSLCIAVIVTAIAMKTFSLVVLPLGLTLGALLFSGACVFSRSRARKHFDRIAWDHIDQIRRTAYETTHKNQQFGMINHFRVKLQQPEFAHLESVVKELDEEIRKFRVVVLSPNYDDKQLIAKTHLAYVKGIIQGHAQDTALIDNLEKEIDKVGHDDEDLQALEMQKQKLNDLQTPQAILHAAELQQQVDVLVKASEGPALTDSKKSLMEYLAGLQRKLDSSKTIETLSLEDELDDEKAVEIVEDGVNDEVQLVEEDESENP